MYQYPVSNAGRVVPVYNDNDMVIYDDVLRAADADVLPGARLFVGPQDLRYATYSDDFLYFLLPQFVPGSYYLEMDPGVDNAPDSGLANQIAHDDVLILNSEFNGNSANEDEPDAPLESDAANRVVQDDFRLIGLWGSIYLYVRDGSRFAHASFRPAAPRKREPGVLQRRDLYRLLVASSGLEIDSPGGVPTLTGAHF